MSDEISPEVQVDESKAWEIAHAVKPVRDEVVKTRKELETVREEGGWHPIKEAVLQSREKRLEKEAGKIEEQTEASIDLFRRVKSLPKIQSLYKTVLNRAERLGMKAVAADIKHFQEITPEDAMKEYDNQELHFRRPILARMVNEIALVAANDGKMKRKIELPSGEGLIYDYNPLKGALGEYDHSEGILTIVEDAYRLLGLDQRLGEIPEVGSGFFRKGQVKTIMYEDPDLGVVLDFEFVGPSERSGADGLEVTYIPPSVYLRISKAPSPAA